MRAWIIAHVHGASRQAVVCCCGTNGRDAFQESLEAQLTSPRHDSKGLCTYYITGTHRGTSISRVVSGCIGPTVAGAVSGPLHITVTSNTIAWQQSDLGQNKRLVSLELHLTRIITIPPLFLHHCQKLEHINLVCLPAGLLEQGAEDATRPPWSGGSRCPGSCRSFVYSGRHGGFVRGVHMRVDEDAGDPSCIWKGGETAPYLFQGFF